MKNFTLFISGLMLSAFTVFAQPTVVDFEIVDSPLTLGDLPMTASGVQIWGDYNNDGLLDIFVIAGQGSPFSGLFKNNGDGTFTQELTDVVMLSLASAVFFDYDNDGNLDLLVAGSVDGTAQAAITELYRNTGAPNYAFELVESEVFVGISAEGSDNNTRLIEVVDYNNDGWLDVFLSGNAGGTWEVSGNGRVVALYKNTGGSFELQTTPVDGTRNFVSMNGGGIHAGDVNNDGYADMIVSGYVNGELQTVTDLYINNGDGTFSYYEESGDVFTGHMQGETFFVDVNNNGWMDIIEIGRDVNNGWSNFANLYINDMELGFTKIEQAASGLIGGGAIVATGDINNDGFVDLFVSGWGPNATFFYNNGDNSFTPQPVIPDIARARSGYVNFVDFNKDGNLDLTIFGYRDGGAGTPEDPTWPHFLLTNKLAEGVDSNLAPASPENFEATQAEANVVLTWDKATDDTTPSDAIRYNVYAKNKTTGKVYTYFPADIETGFLMANGERPLISGTTITLHGMSTADYTFGVQAIDNAKLGSPFATTASTSVREPQKLDVNIYSHGNRVVISNLQNDRILFNVISLSGKTVYTGACEPNGTEEITLNLRGIFLVQVTGKTAAKVQKITLF